MLHAKPFPRHYVQVLVDGDLCNYCVVNDDAQRIRSICSFASSADGSHPSGTGGSGGTLRHSGLRCAVDLCFGKVLIYAFLFLATVGRRPHL